MAHFGFSFLWFFSYASSYLQQGSNARTTASTDMNHSSSRSHAIFSVILKQTVPKEVDVDQDTMTTEPLTPADDKPPSNTATIVSKFHFVDLAGSERVRR